MTAEMLLASLAARPLVMEPAWSATHLRRLHDFLHTYARTWLTAPAPVTMRGATRECYATARAVAAERREAAYCEGLVPTGKQVQVGDDLEPVHVLHAFVVIPPGLAIECTRPMPTAGEYVGCCFQRDAVQQMRAITGPLEGVLDRTVRCYPDLFENLPLLLDRRWHG